MGFSNTLIISRYDYSYYTSLILQVGFYQGVIGLELLRLVLGCLDSSNQENQQELRIAKTSETQMSIQNYVLGLWVVGLGFKLV